MKFLARLLVVLVAALHAGFGALEMFLWEAPAGLKIFGQTPESAAASAVLAANQGLYNFFLAAGLFWAVLSSKKDVAVFFLLCVIVAGTFGALTAKMSILYVQAVPGALAILAVLTSGKWQSD